MKNAIVRFENSENLERFLEELGETSLRGSRAQYLLNVMVSDIKNLEEMLKNLADKHGGEVFEDIVFTPLMK